MFDKKTLTVCVLLVMLAACFVGPVLADSTAHQEAQAIADIESAAPGVMADPAPTVPPRPITVRIEGIITAIMALPGQISIDGVAIIVTAETSIIPRSYTPQVGDYVTATAVRTGDALTATRIKIHQGTGVTNPIEFRGVITWCPGAPYIGEWTIGGIRVDVDTRAVVVDSPVIGYYAQVEGWVRQNRTVLANRIQILDPADIATQFEFEGTIQEMASAIPGQWTVGGIRGQVNADTVVEGMPQVGDTVEVRGRSLRSAPVFEHIRVISEDEREVRIAGLIAEIHGAQGYWVVGQTQVEVDETTFVDESRARAAVGMWAEVIARRKGPFLQALRIRVERPE